MKKYPLEFRTEGDFKWYISEVVLCEQAVQLNNIANELARANEGIEGIGMFTKFLIPLLEKAFNEEKK